MENGVGLRNAQRLENECWTSEAWALQRVDLSVAFFEVLNVSGEVQARRQQAVRVIWAGFPGRACSFWCFSSLVVGPM